MSDTTSEEVPEQKIDPTTLFPAKTRKAVEGLTYLGQLTEDVSICGHTFGLRTLRPQHKYAIATVLQPWRNTIYEPDIWQNLHVAVALTHVDGKADFCEPMNPNIEDFVKGRLNYIANSETGWYPTVLELLWNHYVLLEAVAANAIAELQLLSQGSQASISSPWLDSLTELGPSEEQMSSVFPPFTNSN
jgi:hypothetical protein